MNHTAVGLVQRWGGKRIIASTLAAIMVVSLVLFPPLAGVSAADWDSAQTVDSGGAVGTFTSVKVNSSGNPRISYYDSTNGDLKFASHDGMSWTTVTVDSGGGVGQYTSLALDASGNPHISYYDVTKGDLKYASSNGATWTTETVDAGGDVGSYSSLALNTSGNPRISYYDATNGDLKHASSDGTTWTAATVDSSGDVGQYTSVALDVSQNPNVSYYDVTNGDLKFASNDGSTWTTATADSSGDVGQSTSLSLNGSGNPRISYYDVTNGDLRYASSNGSTWSTQTVDSAGNVGGSTALDLDAFENPSIAYYDATNADLKFAAFDGTAWSTETVDSAGAVGTDTSFAFGSRNLSISYSDGTNSDLKFVSGLGSPPAKSVSRLWGLTAETTAVDISQEGWPTGSSRAVLVARDDFFSDALAGGPLAYKLREVYGAPAPMLLTPPGSLDAATAAEIIRLGAEKVYLLGGEGAVSAAVKTALEALAGVTEVERLSGATAYGTALAIKAEMADISRDQGSPGPTTAIITTGENFPDALVISGPAAKKNMPILLVKPNTSEPQAETKLALADITDVVIVGGPGAVHPDLEAWLAGNGYDVTKRLWGNSEYDTAIDVVSSGGSIFDFDRSTTLVARGDHFADALAGGPLAARFMSPVVLVEPDSVPEITRLWFFGFAGTTSATDIFKVFMLGGSGAVSDAVLSEIQTIIGA